MGIHVLWGVVFMMTGRKTDPWLPLVWWIIQCHRRQSSNGNVKGRGGRWRPRAHHLCLHQRKTIPQLYSRIVLGNKSQERNESDFYCYNLHGTNFHFWTANYRRVPLGGAMLPLCPFTYSRVPLHLNLTLASRSRSRGRSWNRSSICSGRYAE